MNGSVSRYTNNGIVLKLNRMQNVEKTLPQDSNQLINITVDVSIHIVSGFILTPSMTVRNLNVVKVRFL